MSRMKNLSCIFLWWPRLDQDIESLARNYHICLHTRNQPATAPLYSWKWPSRVWGRVHADFAELDSQHFFILVDVYSKWMEAYPMKTTTTGTMIDILRHIFAIHGTICFRQWTTVNFCPICWVREEERCESHLSSTLITTLHPTEQ